MESMHRAQMDAEREIETERLLLRLHRLEDFEECQAMWSDRKVICHIRADPFSPSETWQRMLRYVGHWDLTGFGYWTVWERSTGVFVGEVGFAYAKRDLPGGYAYYPEIGCTLASPAWGKGFANEAMGAALAWADRYIPTDRTIAITDEQNDGALRLAKKNGYAEQGKIDYEGRRFVLLSRSAVVA